MEYDPMYGWKSETGAFIGKIIGEYYSPSFTKLLKFTHSANRNILPVPDWENRIKRGHPKWNVLFESIFP